MIMEEIIIETGGVIRPCGRCKTPLPRDAKNFCVCKRSPDGLGSTCRKCQYQLNAEWRAKNPERQKANSAAWRDKNKEKEYLRLKAARLADPERARARVKKSYYKNQERRLADRKFYYRTHLEKEKAYAKSYINPNPLHVKESCARKRYRKRGIVVDPIDYSVILKREGMVCHICKGEVFRPDLVFDHIIPIAKGGAHSYENISVSHYVCNRKKHAKILCE